LELLSISRVKANEMDRRRAHKGNGLSFAEIILAVGFLSIFTTGLLAIATKTFEFSRQQVDMAAAYQYGEKIMESYALRSRDAGQWSTMTAVPNPRFPLGTSPTGEQVEDPRFVYTVDVESLDTDLRMVTVRVYKAVETGGNIEPVIDRGAPRAGELLRFVNVYQQEINDA
jgi:hypothetical protein